MAYSTPSIKATGLVSVYDGSSWQSLPDPASMKETVSDFDSEDGAGRDQTGTMFRDRVATKTKLEMDFPPMNRADHTIVLGLIKASSFPVRYYSDFYGAWRTATMYVGDRTTESYYMQDANNPTKNIVVNTSFNFIEM